MSRPDRWLTLAVRALSTDFCPSANRWVYWLKNPFWLLLLAIAASLACGFILNPMVFALTAVLVAVAGIGSILPAVMIRATEVSVRFEASRGTAGQPTRIRLCVRNRLPIPICGLTLVRGFITDSDDADAATGGVALARVPMRATLDITWYFTPAHRGVYPKAEPRVETSFPFGLFRASRPIEVTGRLIVWPDTITLDGLPDASATHLAEDRFSDRREGDFGDPVGTREFRSGDSLRRVHWAQTARHQRLITIQRQALESSLVVVTARFRGEETSAGTAAENEHVIRAVASVCRSLHRQHARVLLRLNGESISGDTTLAGLYRMMDALAVVEPQSSPARGSARDESTCSVTVTAQPDRTLQGASLVVPIGEELESVLPTAWRRLCHVS